MNGGVYGMNCIETQALITPFIKDKLNSSQLETFLRHVTNCPDCYEELEVYFAIYTAMKQLDNDEEMPDNFEHELQSRIQECEEHIVHTKFLHIKKRVIFFCMICMIGLGLGVSFGVMDDTPEIDLQKQELQQFLFKHEIIWSYQDSDIVRNLQVRNDTWIRPTREDK